MARTRNDAETIAALSTRKGIGIRPAEMLLLHGPPRPAGFSHGALAILRGVRMAPSRKDSLANADGLLRAERLSASSVDGRPPSMSAWRDAESMEKWRSLAAHKMYRQHRRMHVLRMMKWR